LKPSGKQSFSHIAREKGWDNVVLILSGLGGVLLAVLDLFQLLNWETGTHIKVCLLALGLLLVVAASQDTRRSQELEDLRLALTVAEVKPLDMKHEFPRELARIVSKTQRFVLDTNLNNDIPRLSAMSPQEEYRSILERRLKSGDLAFRQVVCIFHREHLEEVIRNLYKFRGTDYYVYNLEPPPRAIPIIHMMAFDDDHYFLGGFHSAEASTQETVLYLRHPEISEFLKEYWSVLWNRAKALNPGRAIDWPELERIAARLGIDSDSFKSMNWTEGSAK
jgi:hypothetical protein